MCKVLPKGLTTTIKKSKAQVVWSAMERHCIFKTDLTSAYKVICQRHLLCVKWQKHYSFSLLWPSDVEENLHFLMRFCWILLNKLQPICSVAIDNFLTIDFPLASSSLKFISPDIHLFIFDICDAFLVCSMDIELTKLLWKFWTDINHFLWYLCEWSLVTK